MNLNLVEICIFRGDVPPILVTLALWAYHVLTPEWNTLNKRITAVTYWLAYGVLANPALNHVRLGHRFCLVAFCWLTSGEDEYDIILTYLRLLRDLWISILRLGRYKETSLYSLRLLLAYRNLGFCRWAWAVLCIDDIVCLRYPHCTPYFRGMVTWVLVISIICVCGGDKR